MILILQPQVVGRIYRTFVFAFRLLVKLMMKCKILKIGYLAFSNLLLFSNDFPKEIKGWRILVARHGVASGLPVSPVKNERAVFFLLSRRS